MQNSILQSVLSESGTQHQYKYAVTSTILQHNPGNEQSNDIEENVGGKRGMHSATGAFWNAEKDGMWSYKDEKEDRDFDVIISVIWISVL